MNLTEYKKETLASGAIMGWVVMLSLTDTLTPRRDMVKALNANGFDGSQAPTGMNLREAFRYATSKPTAGSLTEGDKEYNLLVREIRDPYPTKQIVVEGKDATLQYGAAAQIWLNTDLDTIVYKAFVTPEPLPTAVQELVNAVVVKMQETARSAIGALDYSRTRKLVIGVLERQMTGFQLHRSVWYVPGRTDEALQRLSTTLDEAGLQGAKLVLLPLLDTEVNRDMVIDAFRENATKDYLSLIERANKVAADVAKGITVRGVTGRGLMEEYKRQTLANKDHIADLSVDIETLKSTAAAARSAVENAMLAVQAQS